MNEATAWLRQSNSDRHSANVLVAGGSAGNADSLRCHAIAKWQQSVEKATKAIVAALRIANVLHIEIGYDHNVERFMRVLLRLPRSREHLSIQQHLRTVFDENTRGSIRALDALAPRRPVGGGLPGRNTEYPFQDSEGNWSYPAAEQVFSDIEAQRFRELAHRITGMAEKIVFGLARKPK